MTIDPTILSILKNNINVPGLFNDLIDQVGEPALKSAIDKSDTKIDDIVFAALEPLVKSELKKYIAAKWEELLSAPAAVVPPGPLV